MKKFSKISVVLLISLFCILGLSTIAFAEETQSSNGLQASIVTDSDEYKTSDDIKVDFKVKNTNGFDINSVSMNTVVPKGLTVKDNAPTNKDVGTLKSGKEESYSVILNANGTGSNTHNNTNTTNELPKSGNTTNNESTVGTGDTTNVVILAIILVIAAVVIICNRKKLSKHISVMLCFAVCLTSIPMISMSSANAAEQDSFTVNKTVKIDGKNYTVGLKISYENNTHSNNVQPSDNESVVTRGEWAEMLVTEFSMKEVSKSDTELPYNDINNSKYCSQIVTAYYHSILPTNIEEFKPDEYATRDFAAYTLNNCLGYVKNSDLKCNDFDSIKYQDEVSALTERGYFELENNKFMPEKAVTTAEMDKIKSLIAESLEGLKIDENHENVIDVNDDAVIIYDNVIKSIDGNTVTLIVNNETSKLKEGSIFFVPNPENVVQMLSYKVESISVSDGKVVVVTSTPDITEMYDEVDVQGIAKSDISEIDVQNKSKSKVVVNASRNVKSSSSVWDNIKNKFNNLFNKEVSYNNTNKLDASKLRFNGKYKIKDKKDNEIVEVELNGGLENPEIEYNVNFKTSKFRIKDDWNFYVALKNTLAFDGTAKLVSKGVGAGEYTLAKVPFEICPGVGVDLSLILTVDIKGEVTVNYKLENTVGVKIDSKNGARFVKDFGNSYPEIEANVEARLGLKSQISLVLASCDVISVNAEIGVKGHAKIKTFRHDFSPHTDLSIYIYANVGYNTNDFIKKVLDSNKKMKLKGEGTEQVIKEENSPFKSKMHIEKLTIVEECTYRYVSGIVKTKGYPLDGVKVSVYDGNNEITLGEGQRNLTSTIGTFGFLIPCKSDNTNYSDKLTFKFSKDGYNDYIKEYTIKTAEDTDIGEIEMTASGDDNGKVYTAAELINMNLNEIIDIMGGDFKVGCDGGDPAKGTSPEVVYIYNYDILPNFKFYIPDANEDNRNGQDVKANIKSGKYDSYEYIRLSNEAKLTDKISANMTYNEISSVIGEFDCIGAAAASGNYFYTTNTVGDITRYIFPQNDSLTNSGINEVNRDWLRNNNPTLSGIIVYPKKDTNIFELIPQKFVFSSGAGGWGTTINIKKDGTFTGNHYDSDLGDTGVNYPKGSAYICNFKGSFTDVTKIDEYTYSMKLKSLEQEGTRGDVYYDDGMKYTISYPYGFDNADEFMLYLPGKPTSELPAGFLNWVHINAEKIPSDIYGLYNVNGMLGFKGEFVDTASELVNMNLNEIINIMGGNFDISAIWSQVRISNYDVFPGMSFGTSYYVSDDRHYGQITAAEEKDFKEQVANGSCNLSGITLYTSGRLDNNINADMRYNELTEFLGDFSCSYGGRLDPDYVLYNSKGNESACFSFSRYDKNLTEEVLANPKEMKRINPKLSSITVLPGYDGYSKINSSKMVQQ